ncbi:hypothetical protein K8R32_02285 [bacterium]|nr:hypothetical protein [bacterium]
MLEFAYSILDIGGLQEVYQAIYGLTPTQLWLVLLSAVVLIIYLTYRVLGTMGVIGVIIILAMAYIVYITNVFGNIEQQNIDKDAYEKLLNEEVRKK